MDAESKEKAKLAKPDAYLVDTINVLVELKKIVREEAIPHAASLFEAYNRILRSGPDRLKNDQSIADELVRLKDTFDALGRKITKLSEPARAPFSLKVTIGGAREKGKKHMSDCSKAAQALISYVSGGPDSELQTAFDLLSPMAG